MLLKVEQVIIEEPLQEFNDKVVRLALLTDENAELKAIASSAVDKALELVGKNKELVKRNASLRRKSKHWKEAALNAQAACRRRIKRAAQDGDKGFKAAGQSAAFSQKQTSEQEQALRNTRAI